MNWIRRLLEDTERTWFCPQTDRRTRWNQYTPFNFVGWGYKNATLNFAVITVLRMTWHRDVRSFAGTAATEAELNQKLNSQKAPHTSPLRASYGVSSVRIREKIDRVITAPECICFENVRPPPVLWGDTTRCRHLPHKASSSPLLASAHWWKCSEARNLHLSQHSDTAKRCHNEFLDRMRFQNSKICYKWNNKIHFSMTWFNNLEISVAPGNRISTAVSTELSTLLSNPFTHTAHFCIHCLFVQVIVGAWVGNQIWDKVTPNHNLPPLIIGISTTWQTRKTTCTSQTYTRW